MKDAHTHRYAISGGGTGGGTYPAIAVAAALKHRHPDADILWIGSKHGIERGLVERAGLPFRGVAGGPIVGVGLRAIPSAVKLAVGTLEALGHLRRFRPGGLLMTGGWPSLPATMAAWLLRVPILIYLPDLEPGSTIRITSRIAQKVATNFPRSDQFFPPGKTVTCGYPLRADLLRAAGYDASGQPLPGHPDAEAEAAAHFSLSDDAPVLLAFGGSKGTGSINAAIVAALPELLPMAQVIHITGRDHFAGVQAEAARHTADLPDWLPSRYHPVGYLPTEQMALALAAADLVVSRAGAATLAEFPLFGLPAILVPLARAWRYQRVNAEFLAEHGAAVVVSDEDLAERLLPEVTALLRDDARRRRMAKAAAALRRPDAAARIVDALTDLPAGKNQA